MLGHRILCLGLPNSGFYSQTLLNVVVWLYSVLTTSLQADNICLNENDGCRCIRPGMGPVDLRPIANTDGTARFRDVPGLDGVVYSYNPCIGFRETDPQSHAPIPQCQNVVICARNGTHYNATAIQKNAKFDYDSQQNSLFVRYFSEGVSHTVTKVYLQCGMQETLQVNRATVMTLQSPCVCEGGCSLQTTLSPGSIMLLIFFTGMASYFVIGCLVNKAINGAVGREMIPNYSFWSELPALIKDGYLFFLSPCLGDQVRYSNIYQNI